MPYCDPPTTGCPPPTTVHHQPTTTTVHPTTTTVAATTTLAPTTTPAPSTTLSASTVPTTAPTTTTAPPAYNGQPIPETCPGVQIITPTSCEAPPTTPPRCEEDQPCWSCPTMGNMICGSVPVPMSADAIAVVQPTSLPNTGAPVGFETGLAGLLIAVGALGVWLTRKTSR